MQSCSAVHDLVPAYALGALDADEAIELERHVAICRSCRRVLEEDRAVVAALALAPRQQAPPPGLQARLMAAVRAERAVEERGSFWRRLFPAPLAAATGAAAMATLAFLITLGWGLGLQSRLDAATAAAARPNPSAYGEQPAWTLTRAQMHRLSGSEAAPDARGWIYLDPGVDQALLVAYKLPPLPPDRAYQLWLVERDQRVSGGLFEVDAEGYGWLKVQAPKPFGSFERIGITVEPRTGSPGPTGARVLGGNL